MLVHFTDFQIGNRATGKSRLGRTVSIRKILVSQVEFCISKHKAKKHVHSVLTKFCLFLLGEEFAVEKPLLQTAHPLPSLHSGDNMPSASCDK